MNTVKPKTCIFACGINDESSLDSAREYIKKHSLTWEDVKLLRSDQNGVSVWTKRKVTLNEQ